MKTILFAKFTQNPALSQQLLSTGDVPLIEANRSDSFWGAGATKGQILNRYNRLMHHETIEQCYPGSNVLGQLLMELRSILRAKNGPQRMLVVGDSMVKGLKTVGSSIDDCVSLSGYRANAVFWVVWAIYDPTVAKIVVLCGTNDLSTFHPRDKNYQVSKCGSPPARNPYMAFNDIVKGIRRVMAHTSATLFIVDILPRLGDYGYTRQGKRRESAIQLNVRKVNKWIDAWIAKTGRSYGRIYRIGAYKVFDSDPSLFQDATKERIGLHLSQKGSELLLNTIVEACDREFDVNWPFANLNLTLTI